MPKKAKKVTKDKSVNKMGLVKEVVIMGGYGYKAAAEAAAADFLRPSVFAYQTAIFPSPAQHGVDVLIKKAVAAEIVKPTTPLYPWSVELTIEVRGAKAQGWMQSFKDRTRGIRL